MRDHGRAVRTRVGRTIQQLRRLRSWSQEELAERAETSSKHVGQIERGEVSAGLDGLARIADALSVNIADLFVEARGRRPARAPIYVITGEDLDTLANVGDLVRRIKSPRVPRSSK